MELLAALLLLLADGQSAPAGTLVCYPHQTQIGVVARREIPDRTGTIERTIYYRAAGEMPADGTCREDGLRVYETHVYQRDAKGRTIVERILDPGGRLARVARHDYAGESTRPSKTSYANGNDRPHYEVRRLDDEATDLHFDEHGRVVAVRGLPPTDVEYGIAWGSPVDGWRAGAAVARGSLSITVENGTAKGLTVRFPDVPEIDLREAGGRLIPLLPEMAARLAGGDGGWSGMLVESRELGFHSVELASLYGPLRPGRYTLIARHPHPVTRAPLVTGELAFEIR